VISCVEGSRQHTRWCARQTCAIAHGAHADRATSCGASPILFSRPFTVRVPLAVIVNPIAGAGRAQRLLPAARAAVRRHGGTDEHIMLTQHAGDEATLTRDALARGARVIVAIGGDGTLSRVGTTIAMHGSEACLVPVAGGSGNDFVKSIAAPVHDPATLLALAHDGAVRAIDIGVLDDVPFLNVAGLGFDADVVAHAAQGRWLPPAAHYAAAALRRLTGFAGVRLTMDDAPPDTHLIAAFANGRAFGGAFRIAPDAALDDGLLDAVLIRDASTARRIALLAHAVRGTHVTQPEARIHRAAHFALEVPVGTLVQRDGELDRTRSAHPIVTVRPRALRVVWAT
jgi:diacylglycerol kinase (ATP)